MTPHDTKEATSLGIEMRRHMRKHRVGVLSTHSQKLVDYPFGSVVPFVLDHDARPVFLISRLAEHFRNMVANSKVSLLAQVSVDSDIQATSRLTMIGDAAPITVEYLAQIQARYLRFFENSIRLIEMGDFSFWHLSPKWIRFIGGFGRIHWVSADEYLPRNNAAANVEDAIVNELNSDQSDRLLRACIRRFGRSMTSARFLGIDCDGFDLLVNDTPQRIDFENPIYSINDIHAFIAEWLERPK